MVMALLLSTMAMGLAGCAKTGDNGENGEGEGTGKEEEIVDTSKMTGEEHLQYVEGKAINGLVNTLTKSYGQMFGAVNGSAQGGRIDMALKLGDAFIEEMENGMGQNKMDMSWLSEINLGMDVASEGSMSKLALVLGLAGTDILSADMIMDMDAGQLWMGLPELNKTYLKFDLEDMGIDMSDVGEATAMMAELMAAMPSEDVLNRLLTKYVDIILKNLDDVQKETITLELDGLKQECTALTVEIGHEDALRIAKAVLTAAREDEDVKAVLEGIVKFVAANGATVDGDIWEMFQAEIDKLLEDIEEQMEDIQEGVFVLTTYADSKNHIIGRSLATPDTDADQLFYKTVTEGDKFAFEAVVMGQATITGSGTNKGGKLSGSYELAAQGRTMLTLEVEDVDQNKLEKGYISGTFRIKPHTYTTGTDSSGATGVTSTWIANMEVELKLTTSAQSAEIEINLNYQGNFFAGAAIKVSSSSGGSVSAPGSSVDATGQTALMEWLMDADFSKLLQNLKKAGAPSMLTHALQQEITQLNNSPYN